MTMAFDFLRSLFGGDMKTHQVPLYNQQQQQSMNQFLQQGLQNSNFSGIENQAKQQFNEETIPGLAERFTSMGQGAQNSSAFQGALGRAGAGLQTNLAALRSQYGLQQSQLGLKQPFENVIEPASGGFFGGLMQGGAQGAGQAGSMAAMAKYGMFL